MKDTILVLTNSEDGVHSDIVISKLLQAGETVFRMDSDRLASGSLQVRFTCNSESSSFEIRDDSQSVSSGQIKSIWYRRPDYFNLDIKDPIQKSHAERELAMLLSGLWSIVPREATWLSRPAAIEKARKKVLQMKLGRELGLLVPPTIISNDPSEVTSFYEENNGKIVFKSIYHEFLDYGTKGFTIPTTIITPLHLSRLDLVRKLPGMFQKFIAKKYELRVTVVGDQVFAAKISPSETSSFGTVDWRNPKFVKELKCSSAAEISKEVSDICLKMMNVLGLGFAAFDFAVDEQNDLYFFEVNPNGQWYWIESSTGMLISDAIVDTLRVKRR